VSLQGPRTTIADHRREPAPSSRARERLVGARGVSAASPLVGAARAAELMQVPPSWLLSQARAQKVPHHKLGHYVRFDIEELIAWLEERKVPPRPQRGGR
jgi:hypothetical protein